MKKILACTLALGLISSQPAHGMDDLIGELVVGAAKAVVKAGKLVGKGAGAAWEKAGKLYNAAAEKIKSISLPDFAVLKQKAARSYNKAAQWATDKKKKIALKRRAKDLSAQAKAALKKTLKIATVNNRTDHPVFVRFIGMFSGPGRRSLISQRDDRALAHTGSTMSVELLKGGSYVTHPDVTAGKKVIISKSKIEPPTEPEEADISAVQTKVDATSEEETPAELEEEKAPAEELETLQKIVLIPTIEVELETHPGYKKSPIPGVKRTLIENKTGQDVFVSFYGKISGLGKWTRISKDKSKTLLHSGNTIHVISGSEVIKQISLPGAVGKRRQDVNISFSDSTIEINTGNNNL